MRIDLPHRSGRHADWLKVKCVDSGDFVVIGYQPDERAGIVNLKLVVEKGGKLRHADAAGTGWSVHTMREVLKRLNPLAVKRSPVTRPAVNGAVWTSPELRAEVGYRCEDL
jgi:bifunctional non-homologous end joining protein LigD